jgi:tyrosyl-tRNA synthetase
MKDKIFDVLPDDQKFEELTEDDLSSVLNKVKGEDPAENNCIIFDDMTAYLKNKDTLKLLKEMIFNRRHFHLSIYFLVQTWNSVPKDIRKLFNNIFVFKVSKNEMEGIFEEVVEQKKELIPQICKVVFSEPYQYLFINTESQRLFKGFDELIIAEDNLQET